MSSGKANNIVGDWHINGTQMTASAATLNAAIKGTAADKVVAGGVYTVTAGDDTANGATIATGLTTVVSGIVLAHTAANLRIATFDAGVTFSGANIVIADGITYACTAGHLIHWIAFGT